MCDPITPKAVLHRDGISHRQLFEGAAAGLAVASLAGAVVLGMDTGNVDLVFVAGKAKKRNGQLLGIDLKRIAADAVASRDYLASKVRT